MAAADFSVSFAGQANGAGAADGLFLKVFAGEVLTAFSEANKFAERTLTRSITSGKSAQFPATWKATGGYHTPGTYLVGQQILSNERVITIDDLLTSQVFIASIDEAKSHFEFRSEYSKQVGLFLAYQMDKNLAQNICLAARASATITGANGGTQIVNSTAKTNADSLIASVADAVQALDEKDVPMNDRFVALPPDQYLQLLTSGSRAINRDYNSDSVNGGVGSGEVYKLFGAEIVRTNHIPKTNVTTGPAAYQGNFSNTAAVVWQRGAVGTVKLMDLAVEMEYLIQNQGTLIVAKYAIGHGILRPECAVEVVTA